MKEQHVLGIGINGRLMIRMRQVRGLLNFRLIRLQQTLLQRDTAVAYACVPDRVAYRETQMIRLSS